MAALKSSKGQLEISESLMVLFIIVILIAIGIFLYYRYSSEGIKARGEELSDEKANILLATITSMPEIGCDKEDCVDTSKLISFSKVTKTRQNRYNQLLGFKKIKIYQLYPEAEKFECDTASYNSFQYPNNCNFWSVYENKPKNVNSNKKISKIVSLYFPEMNEYRIGRLEIETFS